MDRYDNFAQLYQNEMEGQDFVILVKTAPCAPAVMAPHGGGIEPGTVDLAYAIAGIDYPFYAFKGIKPSGNAILHLTSDRFDEPRALRMAHRHQWVLTIHGCREESRTVFVGGRDSGRRQMIMDTLRAAGFDARESQRPGLRGIFPNNICNRGYSGRGVQLEISDGLRQQMFDRLRQRTNRRKTEVFHRFVAALRNALSAPGLRPATECPEIVRGRTIWRLASDPGDRLKASAVRAIVFMEEQDIAFEEEFDPLEDEAVHILGEIQGEPVAAGRLRFSDGWAKLERIAVRRAWRGRGVSHDLIDFMLREAAKRGCWRCRLHAQVHLIDLYRKHGFYPRGETFSEVGIDHRLMVRETPAGSEAAPVADKDPSGRG